MVLLIKQGVSENMNNLNNVYYLSITGIHYDIIAGYVFVSKEKLVPRTKK